MAIMTARSAKPMASVITPGWSIKGATGQLQGMSPAAIIMLVAAAGALGDSGSPSSNQTLVPTSAFNIDGQHDHIKDSCIPSFIFVNIPIIVVCTIASLFI